MSTQQESDKLKSIESQLTRINEKFDTVIRLEEKHNSLAARVQQCADKLHKHANLLMELQYKSAMDGKVVGGVERFMWLAVAAALGGVVFLFRELP